MKKNPTLPGKNLCIIFVMHYPRADGQTLARSKDGGSLTFTFNTKKTLLYFSFMGSQFRRNTEFQKNGPHRTFSATAITNLQQQHLCPSQIASVFCFSRTFYRLIEETKVWLFISLKTQKLIKKKLTDCFGFS